MWVKLSIKEGSRIEENVSIERDPKTPNSFRVLRVPEVIITELEKRKCQIDMYKEKMQEAFIDNDYISCQANGKVHSLSAMNNALTKLCVRNGLPAVTVHGLRHPYVKHKTKSFLRNSRVFKADFCAPSHSLCTEVFHFPDNINLISGVNIHTFNQCVSQGGI